MTTIIADVYDAPKAAGAPEEKARAAARAPAGPDRRFDGIDGKLAALEARTTTVKWISGATFAGVPALMAKTFFT